MAKSGKLYFKNHGTKGSQWDDPRKQLSSSEAKECRFSARKIWDEYQWKLVRERYLREQDEQKEDPFEEQRAQFEGVSTFFLSS